MSTTLEQFAELRAPDEVEARIAWRVFRVGQPYRREGEGDPMSGVWLPRADRWLLLPISLGGVWSREMTASCPHGVHAAPHVECSCGLWSVKTLGALQRCFSGGTSGCAIGRVRLWGRVVEHEHGYRSEKAALDRVWVGADIPPTATAWGSGWANPYGYTGPRLTAHTLADIRREYGCPVTFGNWYQLAGEYGFGDDAADVPDVASAATSVDASPRRRVAQMPSLLALAVGANLTGAALNVLSLAGVLR